MAVNVALFAAGEALLLAGVAMWSLPLALVLAGVQCLGLGLLRAEPVAVAAARRAAPAGRRGRLRLVRRAS